MLVWETFPMLPPGQFFDLERDEQVTLIAYVHLRAHERAPRSEAERPKPAGGFGPEQQVPVKAPPETPATPRMKRRRGGTTS